MRLILWRRQWPGVLTVFDGSLAALRYSVERNDRSTRHHLTLRLGRLCRNETDIALTVTTRRYPKERR